MPRHTPYALRWSPQTQSYEIFSQTGSVLWTSVPDGSTWLTWLESISSFAFYSRSGAHCTVRKETIQQRGAYWYSYRSLQGRTTKRYLGRTDNISLERLEAVAESFLHASSVRATAPDSLPVSSDASTFSASLVTSRLYPPRLPPVLLRRQQLLARFATWRSYKLTLLMAPAGFGKTTLVNSWLAERQRSDSAEQIAWITLAPDDNNPLYFWRTLIVACQTWEPYLGEKALIQLPSTLQPLFKSVSLETILIQLLNDLARQEKESILVLDDYHLIEEPQIHAAMSFFLEHLPGNLHIVIATRSEPPFPLVRWRAQGVVQEMHASHLRFSFEETSEFLKQTFARQLSSTSLQELHTFLNGWAAGLRLLTFTFQGYSEQEIERALLTLGKHTGGSLPQKPLLDYLVAEILQQQPEYLQRFLLQTGGFERLNASFCNALTGREDSAALLEAIGKANLFLEEVDGEVDRPDLEYRYHTVFAEALRREASVRLSTEQMYDLARRASHWYEQEARYKDAIEMALRAHEIERAVILIEQKMNIDDNLWEMQMVYRWLEPLPETTILAYPTLCLLSALALWFIQREKIPSAFPFAIKERIELLLEVAERGWQKQGKQSWIGLIYAFRSMYAWGAELTPFRQEYAHRALALLPANDPDRRIQIWRCISLFSVGMGNLHDGLFDEAQNLFQQAYRCSLVLSNPSFSRGILLMQANAQFALGNLNKSIEYYRSALVHARKQEDNEDIVFALLGLARVFFEQNDLVSTEIHIQEGLANCSQKEQKRYDALAFQSVLLHYGQGQITNAQQQLAALLARLQVTSVSFFLPFYIEALTWQARLQLITGNLTDAQHNLEQLRSVDATLPFPESARVQLLQARLLLARDQYQQARRQVEELLPGLEQRKLLRGLLEAWTLLALIHAAGNQEREAHQYLQQALLRARGEGFLRLFLDEGRPLAHLLRSLIPTLEDPLILSYAQGILGAFARDSITDNSYSHKLSKQERRVLRLLASGYTNPEIAEELVVSINTVKDHVRNLYRKLHVTSRLEATEAARLHNLL